MTAEDMHPYLVVAEHIEAVGRINYVRYYKDVRTDSTGMGTSYVEDVPVHREKVDMILGIAWMSVPGDSGVGTSLDYYYMDMDTGGGGYKCMVGNVPEIGHQGLNSTPVQVPVLVPVQVPDPVLVPVPVLDPVLVPEGGSPKTPRRKGLI